MRPRYILRQSPVTREVWITMLDEYPVTLRLAEHLATVANEWLSSLPCMLALDVAGLSKVRDRIEQEINELISKGDLSNVVGRWHFQLQEHSR